MQDHQWGYICDRLWRRVEYCRLKWLDNDCAAYPHGGVAEGSGCRTVRLSRHHPSSIADLKGYRSGLLFLPHSVSAISCHSHRASYCYICSLTGRWVVGTCICSMIFVRDRSPGSYLVATGGMTNPGKNGRLQKKSQRFGFC